MLNKSMCWQKLYLLLVLFVLTFTVADVYAQQINNLPMSSAISQEGSIIASVPLDMPPGPGDVPEISIIV